MQSLRIPPLTAEGHLGKGRLSLTHPSPLKTRTIVKPSNHLLKCNSKQHLSLAKKSSGSTTRHTAKTTMLLWSESRRKNCLMTQTKKTLIPNSTSLRNPGRLWLKRCSTKKLIANRNDRLMQIRTKSSSLNKFRTL